jgi:mRNA interferase MazF
MGRFAKGEVVVVPFPFTDSDDWKPRPALVVAQLSRNDSILCAIMTPRRTDSYAISLSDIDFQQGSIDHPSIIRPNRLFTADDKKIIKPIGKLNQNKVLEVIQKLIQMIQG